MEIMISNDLDICIGLVEFYSELTQYVFIHYIDNYKDLTEKSIDISNDIMLCNDLLVPAIVIVYSELKDVVMDLYECYKDNFKVEVVIV